MTFTQTEILHQMRELEVRDTKISNLNQELSQTKVELSEARTKLAEVGSVLIQTQHELHEQRNQAPSFFSLWKA